MTPPAQAPVRAMDAAPSLAASLRDWDLPRWLTATLEGAAGRGALAMISFSDGAIARATAPWVIAEGALGPDEDSPPARLANGSIGIFRDERGDGRVLCVFAPEAETRLLSAGAADGAGLFSIAGLGRLSTSAHEALWRLADRAARGERWANALTNRHRRNDRVIAAAERRLAAELARSDAEIRKLTRRAERGLGARLKRLWRDLRGRPRPLAYRSAPPDLSLYLPLRAARSAPTPVAPDAILAWTKALRAAGQRVHLILSTVDWGGDLRQRAQHLARALAARGDFVIFQRPLSARGGSLAIEAGLVVSGHPSLPHEIEGAIIHLANTTADHAPAALAAMREKNILLYDVIDAIDPAISGKHVEALRAIEAAMLEGGADCFLVTARVLEQRLRAAGVPSDDILFVPNGVEPAHFAPVEGPAPEPIRRLEAGRRAIVGYVGAIAPWIDLALIDRIAAGRPDLGFLLIGPDYAYASRAMPRRANVSWIGPVDYELLPFYMRHFDVGLIPFRPGEIARTTSPLKLYEYFAAGLPVAVTEDLDEARGYPFVFSGGDATGMAAAIDAALAARSQPDCADQLAALASAHAWSARAGAISRFLDPIATEGRANA